VTFALASGRAAPGLRRPRPAGSARGRVAAARPGEPCDGSRVVRGVVLGCLLGVPAWVGIGLLVRAAL
jgi:hypothetical protein